MHFFNFFFTVEGEGGNRYIFSPRYMGLGWKEDGEMGTLGSHFKIYICCVWMDDGTKYNCPKIYQNYWFE
jgi:hypothetical protein